MAAQTRTKYVGTTEKLKLLIAFANSNLNCKFANISFKFMAQRNEVIMVGRIGDKLKYSMSQTGNEYVYFMLEVENQNNATEVDRQYHQNLHVTCFKRPVVKYLKNVQAKAGNIVILFGYVGSFANEIKGKHMIQNTIIAKEIYVVKTKA